MVGEASVCCELDDCSIISSTCVALGQLESLKREYLLLS